VWDETVRGHLHLMSTEAGARRGEPWRVVDVAGHPFEPLEGGAELPPDAGELLEAGLSRLEIRFYRSAALGAVSRLGEPLAAFRSRMLGSLRPEIQYRVEQGREHGGVGEEVAGAVSAVGGRLEEMVIRAGPGIVRKATLGMVFVPGGVELRQPALWDEMVVGSVRGGRRP